MSTATENTAEQQRKIQEIFMGHKAMKCVRHENGDVTLIAFLPAATYRIGLEGELLPLNGQRLEAGDYWDFPALALPPSEPDLRVRNGDITIELVEVADEVVVYDMVEFDEVRRMRYDDFINHLNTGAFEQMHRRFCEART